MASPKVGILGQAAPGAATSNDIYTVPAGRRAVISSIVIAETGGGGPAVRVHARIGGAAAAVGNALLWNVLFSPNTHTGITEGWTLAATDILTVRSDLGGVTFTVFGEETEVPAS